MKKSRRLWWFIVAAYAAVVLVFSIIPTAPSISIGRFDKLAHVIEYLIFAWILMQAIRASRMHEREYLIWAWIYATSYGLLMELIQAMIPWRSADLLDAASNAFGAAIGVWLCARKTGVYFPIESHAADRNTPSTQGKES